MASNIIRMFEWVRRRQDLNSDTRQYTIEHAWRDHFAPVVRSAGFTGSGRHFRRSLGEFVQTVNLQGSRYGGQFFVNLGLQPLAVADVSGRPVDLKRIQEIDCLFRQRLSEDVDRRWRYGDSRQSKEDAAQAAAARFESVGLSLFEEQSDPEAPILTITGEQFEADNSSLSGFGITVPLLATSLARLRLAQNRPDEARAFARIALDKSTPNFGHRKELERIAATGR